ncbi:MAG: cobalamin adenosyltransferase [Bacillota bacterium]|nr:cobalamin adenosyltransferase [Bacillota bacterium]
MKAITELELRDNYKKAPFTSYMLPEGCRLTPSAAQFLSERKIQLVAEKAPIDFGEANNKAAEAFNKKSILEVSGEKPEYLTHLRGKTLVAKAHPVIKFRGKLDTLEAIILETVIEADKLGVQQLAQELTELLEYCRQMMRAEVKEEPLPSLTLLGWSSAEIRERSHYPSKYYNTNHFTPQPSQGRLMAQLNFIRTQCRELELAAIEAFYEPGEIQREDILEAVNRFSSLIYVLMVQLKAGHYTFG